MEGADMLQTMKKTHEESIKNMYYKEIAYQDALTKLKNRVAFNDEVEAIASGKRKFGKMICVSVDVNGLKIVNDTMGHLAGDVLIKETAGFLNRYFSACSSIYRIGGDEFFLFVYERDEEEVKAVFRVLRADVAVYNKTSSVPVWFAIGYSPYDGSHLERCIYHADANMYKCKESMRSEQYAPRSVPAMPPA